jgi:hypothetical protein
MLTLFERSAQTVRRPTAQRRMGMGILPIQKQPERTPLNIADLTSSLHISFRLELFATVMEKMASSDVETVDEMSAAARSG